MFKLENDHNIIYNEKYNVYYYIHENGFVINLNTGHITTAKNKQNYISIKQKKFKLDTLIYCKYNRIEYNNKIKLIHLDDNILNNEITNLKVGYKYNIKKYIPINYHIIYKKYDKNLNLLCVYTNFKFIHDIKNMYDRIAFLKNLLDNNVLYTDTEIWIIEIINIDIHNLEKKIYYIDNYFDKFENLIDIEEVNKYLYYEFHTIE